MVTKNLFSLAATSAKCLCLVAAAATALSLASCSDDDDGDGGSSYGSETAGQVTGTDGVTYWITGANGLYFDYDDEGTLVGITDGDYDYEVSYNPFTISYSYEYKDDYYETYSATWSNIVVNSNGYITSAKISYEGTEEDDESNLDSYSGSQSLSFTYDNDGHITEMSASHSYSGKGSYEGETFSWSGKGSTSISYTWGNDLLKEIAYSASDKGTDSGEDFSDSYTRTYTYDYTEDYPNATLQYTPALIMDVWGDIGTLWTFSIGYNGKGPAYHPTSCDAYEVDDYYYEVDDYYEESYTLFMKYDLNDSGTVGTFYYTYDEAWSYYYRIKYAYSQLSDLGVKTRATVKETPSSEEGNSVRKHRGFLGSRRHHLRSAESE